MVMPLSGLQESLDSLDDVVFDNRLTLDYLLAEQEGVYAVINKTCSTYSNNLGEVELSIQEIMNKLNGYMGSATPLPKLYGTQLKVTSLALLGSCISWAL